MHFGIAATGRKRFFFFTSRKVCFNALNLKSKICHISRNERRGFFTPFLISLYTFFQNLTFKTLNFKTQNQRKKSIQGNQEGDSLLPPPQYAEYLVSSLSLKLPDQLRPRPLLRAFDLHRRRIRPRHTGVQAPGRKRWPRFPVGSNVSAIMYDVI